MVVFFRYQSNLKIVFLTFNILLLAFAGLLNGDEIKITSEIDAGKAVENQPLSGTITITHNVNEVVDIESFKLNKDKITPLFVKNVELVPNNPLVISIYSFQISGQPQGLYALPSVSVKVGGKTYQSSMSSYSVAAAASGRAALPDVKQAPAASPLEPTPQMNSPISTPSTSASSSSSTATPVLRLEASIEGSNAIYPSQRTKLVYHYFFNGNIELITEKLPLLDAEGMVKIGEKEFKNYAEGNLSVSEISQVVEAVTPGDFSFGPSIIEGYIYQEGPSGEHKRISEKLSSTAPPVTVTVKEFPSDHRPSSFNGAVGKYTFEVALTSGSTVKVGDDLTLNIKITGKGNLQGVPLPQIAKQPGFEGFFRLDDLPPKEEIKDEVKNVEVHLRPLSAEVNEIPSIEFSSFDPETMGYSVVHTTPIPIHVSDTGGVPASSLSKPRDVQPVEPIQSAIEPPPSSMPMKNKTEKSPQPTILSQPSPIEVEGIDELKQADLSNKFGGTWWALGIIPFGIALILFQIYVRKELEKQRKQVKVLSSQTLLNQVWNYKPGTSEYFDGINRALKTGLVEIGKISSLEVATDDLPKDGISGEVRAFLTDIEEKRFAGREFSGKDIIDYKTVETISQGLIDKIHKVKSSPGGVS